MTAAATRPADLVVTGDRLLRLSPHGLTSEQAAAHAIGLEQARPAAAITTRYRLWHFLAQIAHETQGFRSLVENLNYRDPVRLMKTFSRVDGLSHANALIKAGPEAIANTVYAGRFGNGPIESGDGWRYRGRGGLQITFRDNYRAVGKGIGMPLEAHPELLEQPATAYLAAARFWAWKNINAAADRDDAMGVRRLINPALAGLDDCGQWFAKAARIWA